MLPCTSQNSLISPSNSPLAMHANVALKSSSLSRHDTWPYLGPLAPICQWFPAFVTPVKRPFVGSINPSLSPIPVICEPPGVSAFSRPSSSTTTRVPLLPLLLFHIHLFPQEFLVRQWWWDGRREKCLSQALRKVPMVYHSILTTSSPWLLNKMHNVRYHSLL